MSKRVCISGYYGFNNFGDETILKILVENLKKYRPDILISVFSSNPEKTSNSLNVSSVYTFNLKGIFRTILSSDCLISGGGSLLQDVTSAKSLLYYLFVISLALFFRKKVIIFAQGIGPIKNSILRKITALLLKRAVYITVRDENSFNLLKSWKVNSFLCNDPVWNLSLKKQEKSQIIGVQLRQFSTLTEDKLLQLAKMINKYYADKQINILSLQNSIDLKVCGRFKDILLSLNPALKITITENSSNDEIIDTISSLSSLIAMRYHACLVGIKAGVNVFPLSYDCKVENLAKEFDLEYFDLSVSKLSDDKFEKFACSDIKYDKEKIESKFYDFETMLKEI